MTTYLWMKSNDGLQEIQKIYLSIYLDTYCVPTYTDPKDCPVGGGLGWTMRAASQSRKSIALHACMGKLVHTKYV